MVAHQKLCVDSWISISPPKALIMTHYADVLQIRVLYLEFRNLIHSNRIALVNL